MYDRQLDESQSLPECFLRQVTEKLSLAVLDDALKSNGHFEIHFADKKFQRVLLFRKDTL